MSIQRAFYISLMTLLIGFSLFFVNFVVASEDIAKSAVEEAETAMISAYEVFVEAEQVGGDVSGLLANLTKAGEFLAVAQMSYRNGDFDTAVFFANLSRNIGDEVKRDAGELRFQAYRARDLNIELRITGSLVSMFVVGLCSFWGWRAFRRHYYRQVLEMKPEVVAGDS